MTPEFRRIALIVAVLGFLLALFVALRPKDEAPGTTGAATGPAQVEPATTATTATPEPPVTTERITTTAQVGPTTIELFVAGGKPTGGIQRRTVEAGADAVLVVHSDVADEIHFHGYDLSADVEAGGVARIPFTATIPGRFEVELEHSGVQIAELTVRP